MVDTQCPNPQELRDYALGRMAESDWEAIARHVESCPQCQAVLATVDDVADTLVARLREPPPEDSFIKESQCEAALARAKYAAAAGASAAALPFTELGEYKILEELGQGGMGAVYKALHTKLDRVVAVKILSRGRSGDERAIARFEREMKAIGRLDHPHIVRAYDAREIGGMPVLVMEYVEGMDLGRLAQRLGPLPTAEACELVRQAAEGLQYVHENGLVHRDLKPSNLIVTPEGTVKILDLGLARFHFDQPTGEVTHTGQAMGTVDYMAPEQASDSHAADIRADIYSLGCTLYKLLTGRAPFETKHFRGTFEKMTAHVRQPVPPIRDLLPEIPPELAVIVQRMLAKDPADRYAEPAEVVAALTPFCTDADLPDLVTRAMAQQTSYSQPLPGLFPRPSAASSPRPATLALRRRTWMAWGVGLLMIGGGIGFALGILITIETDKDGKTTTKIQIPDQGRFPTETTSMKPDGKTALPGLAIGNKTPLEHGQRLCVYRLRHIVADDAAIIISSLLLSETPRMATDVKTNSLVIYCDPSEIKKIGALLETIDQPNPAASDYRKEEKGKARVPPEPYTIAPGDSLKIQAAGTLWDQPINGVYRVEPQGTVALGPVYGRVKVAGLSLVEAEGAIVKKLREIITKPAVSVTIADWVPRSKSKQPPPPHRIAPGDILSIWASGTILDQPIHGPYLVEPDGQVTLGPVYGRVNLKGLTFEEAEIVVLEKLKEILQKPSVSITLEGWRTEEKRPVQEGTINKEPHQPPLIPGLPPGAS
ncbi:MAG: protein kinase [Pirellulales bacterium]|nr:protein kinase [Pirellulales bacterium]